jgi:hypothetical protein
LNVLRSAYSKSGFKYGVEQFDLKQHVLLFLPTQMSSNLILKSAFELQIAGDEIFVLS